MSSADRVAPFAGGHDYVATLERLIDEAGDAQDGRAVRVFQRFLAAVDRGAAALYPRPYDPGKPPLVDGPLLDARWADDALDLLLRITDLGADPPAEADERWHDDARFFEGLPTCCGAASRTPRMLGL